MLPLMHVLIRCNSSFRECSRKQQMACYGLNDTTARPWLWREKKAAVFLEEEAKAVGAAVVRYADDLEQAESEMSQLLTAASSKVTQQRKSTGSASARLEAQMIALRHQLERAARRRARLVREASEEAKRPLEDEADKLSRRVGDLTSMVEKAKATFTALVEGRPKDATNAVGTRSTKFLGIQINDDLRDASTKAEKSRQARVATAAAQMQRAVQQAQAEAAQQAKKIGETIDVAEKVELAKLHSK
jgi:hypothetical protein